MKRNQTMQLNSNSLQNLMMKTQKIVDLAPKEIKPKSSRRYMAPDPINSVALECHKFVDSYNPKDCSRV